MTIKPNPISSHTIKSTYIIHIPHYGAIKAQGNPSGGTLSPLIKTGRLLVQRFPYVLRGAGVWANWNSLKHPQTSFVSPRNKTTHDPPLRFTVGALVWQRPGDCDCDWFNTRIAKSRLEIQTQPHPHHHHHRAAKQPRPQRTTLNPTPHSILYKILTFVACFKH